MPEQPTPNQAPGGEAPSEELLNAATRLSEQGDLHGAIELLVEGNRQKPSTSVEARIMDLRIAAFQKGSWPGPDTSWPPAHQTLFSEQDEIPEITSDKLDVEHLKAGLLGSGALIVRGLMDEERARTMTQNIDRTFDAACEYANDPTIASPWFRRSPEVSFKGNPIDFGALANGETRRPPAVWASDSPTAAFQMIDFYREVGLHRILAEYFAEPAVLSVRKWVLRCLAPDNGAEAGWHQDGRFLGEDIRTVNLWLSLSDCGADAPAPGIEIVVDSDKTIHETGTHGAPLNWTVGQGLVDELGEDSPIVRPRFRPGDALFFDHFNLHRTSFATGHSEDRYAVESWFFSASTVPGKVIPVIF